MQQKHCYLIEVQYLGFRYHGWQKQPGLKTVHHMIDRTLQYVFQQREFKTLGASRTDAMVSANGSCFELFTQKPVETDKLLEDLNLNLPQDIRVNKITPVSADFNVILDAKVKQYLYLFSFGAKHHPFCAPFMIHFNEELEVEKMQEAAQLFEGTHNFKAFCHQPGPNQKLEREVLLSEVKRNDQYTANFFPEESYLFRVKGKGFLRHQIRLMMGALIEIGMGKLSLEELKAALDGQAEAPIAMMAPPSGLILDQIDYEHLQ